MTRQITFADYSARLLRVFEYIEEQLDTALSPKDLAAIAGFSAFHFQRIFRGMVGESVMAYLRRLRLERAAVRLKYSDRSVTDIAFEAGYEVHEAFTRAFNRHFEVSPSEFRKRERPITFPTSPSRAHFNQHDDICFETMNNNPTLTVTIQARPEQQIAYVHHIGPYDQCGSAWAKLMAWAGSNGHLGQCSAMYGICYDDPDVTDGEKIRYDACITLRDFEAEGGVGKKLIPAGDYAVVRHRGPYSELKTVYRALFGQWLPMSGREAADAPCLEQYWNDPESTEPEDLETDILLPLAPLER